LLNIIKNNQKQQLKTHKHETVYKLQVMELCEVSLKLVFKEFKPQDVYANYIWLVTSLSYTPK